MAIAAYDEIFNGQLEVPEEAEEQGEDEEKDSNELPKPSVEEQGKMTKYVQDCLTMCRDETKPYRDRLLEVYEAFATYKAKRVNDYDTDFKVNMAHGIIEKVLPRIVAQNPRWIVSPRMDDFYPDKPLVDEQGVPLTDPNTIPNTPENKEQLIQLWTAWVTAKKKRYEQTQQFSKVVQDYLTYLFEEYKMQKYLRRWGKSMIINGKGIAKVCYRYELWNRMTKKRGISDREYEEDVRGEYPAIEVKSWSDMFWDPRYPSWAEAPFLIEKSEKVRYWDIMRNKSDYFNLDKLKDVCNINFDSNNLEEYKRNIRNIAGLSGIDIEGPVDKMSLTITYFYGYYAKDEDTEERMVKIGIVGHGSQMLFPICYKKISRKPFVDINCFEDPEVDQPVGFVEPIMSLMDEMNFKKNAASQYINSSLYRSWLWSPQSGIDPRDLQDAPGNIITVPDSVAEAEANFKEIPKRELSASYFQEQNDLDRQVQAMSFTVDTSSQRSNQALTDTATGIRVAFFESNSVIDETRKHFEEGVAELGYQLLLESFENMEENIVFKKMGTEQYWEMNKELIRDAVIRYNIGIEAGSSSFDDIENRRSDSIGFWNFAVGGQKAGLNIDLEESWKEAAQTWEKKDPSKFIKPRSIDQIVAELMGIQPDAQNPGGGGNMPMPPGQQTPASLTQDVAGGNITSAIPMP